MWDRGCWLFIRLSLTSCNVKTHGGWWRAITMTNWNGARSFSSHELTPRLAQSLVRDYISGWAGGGSGEPQAGKVGQWCLGSSVYNVSSVQCPVSSVQCHTMTSCPRGEEGVQAGPVVTPVIMISLHSLSRYCVVEPRLVSSECWKASCDHFS